MLELISTERIDVIALKNGRWLIDDTYLKVLANEANAKLKGTRKQDKQAMQRTKTADNWKPLAKHLRKI